MASKLFSILAAAIFLLSAQGPVSVEAWRSLIANYGDPCGGTICDPAKNLVCSKARICECNDDAVTGIPMEYNEDEDTCLQAVEVDGSAPEGKSAAQIQYGSNQGHGHSHGGNYPEPAQASVTRIEGSYCRRHEECHVSYGPLANCLFDYSYCYCHAFKQETGYHNGQCHLALRLGEKCDYTVQCLLGHYNPNTPHPTCAKNPTHPSERICTEGKATGIIASITLILVGLFTTKFVARI